MFLVQVGASAKQIKKSFDFSFVRIVIRADEVVGGGGVVVVVVVVVSMSVKDKPIIKDRFCFRYFIYFMQNQIIKRKNKQIIEEWLLKSVSWW